MTVVDTERWQERAACRGMEPSLFFPEDNPRGHLMAPEARAICAKCPVRSDCLEYGLREKDGVWGGLSYQQRRRIISLRIRGVGAAA